jgi:putative hydrolase of the HAD superfamily
MGTILRAVIFDYAGVLSMHQPEDDIRRMEELSGVSGRRFQDIYWGLREPYDRGDFDGPAYWHAFGHAVGRSFSPAAIAELIEADTRSWIHVNGVVVRWLERLQASELKTAILSNMGVDLRHYVELHFDWVLRCGNRTFSCDTRAVKPEPAIYKRCLNGLGVSPEEAVFIDDRPVNLEAAEALGIRGLLFDSLEAFAKRVRAEPRFPAVDAKASRAGL